MNDKVVERVKSHMRSRLVDTRSTAMFTIYYIMHIIHPLYQTLHFDTIILCLLPQHYA